MGSKSNVALCAALLLVAVSASALADEQRAKLQQQQQQPQVSEEMHLITKSLEDLLGELQAIKQEANGRLNNMVKNRASTSDQERIRQTVVSRFVLKRVAELERESLGMRDELQKMFRLRPKSGARQEDLDFEAAEPSSAAPAQPSSTTAAADDKQGMPAASTTPKPDEEAKIGFDVEALKKLGEEIGKRLDQFGKEAAKNLGDLLEGVKLVFREPASKTPASSTAAPAACAAKCS